MEEVLLKNKIIECLESQGFKIGVKLQLDNDKDTYKKIQQQSRMNQIFEQRKFLKRNIPLIQKYLIDKNKFDPNKIDLELIEVKVNTIEEILYKWWNLIWWNIPYQRSYGRQLRFILWDKGHNTPFGLISLQSPVLLMSVRDNYLKIPKEELDYWVNRSLQAHRLGALPPYNYLIGGKMVSLSITSNEIREIYKNKYQGKKTYLKNRELDTDLLFLTTTSAFGRSSIYNRLKFKDQIVAISLGYTKGSGSFHIFKDLYKDIKNFLQEKGINTDTSFGNGPSKKVKLLKKAFKMLGLPDYSYHNLKREFFLFPLVSNLYDVIHKKVSPNYYDRPLKELLLYWKERWCLPRTIRNEEWKKFDKQLFLYNLIKENKLI
jgi:hypothetical protein